MNNNQMIKQAYVRGLAARGILRMRAMQKQAAEYGPQIPELGLNNPHFEAIYGRPTPAMDAVLRGSSGKKGLSRGATNAIAGLGSAGVGAIIGALVAYARKKKILGHALAGAGIGGLAGVGGSELYRYLKGNGSGLPEDMSDESKGLVDIVSSVPESIKVDEGAYPTVDWPSDPTYLARQ